MSDQLKQRVEIFKALHGPGRDTDAYIGTSSLVDDLWSEVRQLRAALSQHCARTIPCTNPLECIKQIRSPVVDGAGWAEAAFDGS